MDDKETTQRDSVQRDQLRAQGFSEAAITRCLGSTLLRLAVAEQRPVVQTITQTPVPVQES